jgi:hypothetical protein
MLMNDMLTSIGNIFLNIAFGLYLILYLPQIVHNALHKPFERMSLLMHFMLFLAYSCDLCYGLARHMPWQYITVSSVGIFFLSIQHLQWCLYRYQQKKTFGLQLMLQGLFILLVPVVLFRLYPDAKWQIQIQAWMARICFLLHFLPQIIQYQQRQLKRDAINLNYLILSLSLSICDLVAAYCLHWDMTNVLGSLTSLSLKLFLCLQITRKPILNY